MSYVSYNHRDSIHVHHHGDHVGILLHRPYRNHRYLEATDVLLLCKPPDDPLEYELSLRSVNSFLSVSIQTKGRYQHRPSPRQSSRLGLKGRFPSLALADAEYRSILLLAPRAVHGRYFNDGAKSVKC